MRRCLRVRACAAAGCVSVWMHAVNCLCHALQSNVEAFVFILGFPSVAYSASSLALARFAKIGSEVELADPFAVCVLKRTKSLLIRAPLQHQCFARGTFPF